MGVHCYIIGCSNESSCKASLFRLPAEITNQCKKTKKLSGKRRQTWLSRIVRADLKAKSYPYVRVCSEHFVLGKPSEWFKENDVDWAPSLKLGHQKIFPQPNPHRGARVRQREDRKKNVEAAKSLLDLLNSAVQVEEDICVDPPSIRDSVEEEECHSKNAHSVGCQTDLFMTQICSLECDYNRLVAESIALRKYRASSRITEESLSVNDDRVKIQYRRTA